LPNQIAMNKENQNYRSVTLVTVLLLAMSICFVPSSHASADPFLDGQMKKIESKIGTWERNAKVIEVIAYSVTVIGLVVAALQASSTRWVKGAAAGLALISAALVPINRGFFPADDRSYEKMATQARHKLEAFSFELNQFTSLDAETQSGLRKKFQGILTDVDQLEDNILYNSSSSSVGGQNKITDLLIPSAWADGKPGNNQPPWVEQLPVDDRNMYFVGSGEGKTFDQAHNNALAEARKAAESKIAREANGSPNLAQQPDLTAKISARLANAAEEADTFTAPNPDGGYHGYVLLRLSRSAALFAAQTVFVESGVPYDKAFLNTVQKGGKE
jgi:hypothetical protein